MHAVCTGTLKLSQKHLTHFVIVQSTVFFLNLNNTLLKDVVKNVAAGDIP